MIGWLIVFFIVCFVVAALMTGRAEPGYEDAAGYHKGVIYDAGVERDE